MEYVKIGGRTWNVRILEITEDFNILDTENAGRVIAKGAMTLDRIGTFYSHKVTFAKSSFDNPKEFDDLWMYLSVPRNTGILVELVHNQSALKYYAYTATGSRKLGWINKRNEVVNWENFSCTFTPMEAQVIP